MKTKTLLAVSVSIALAQCAFADTTIFSDDFESGTFSPKWTDISAGGAAAFSMDNTKNASPADGTWSLKTTLSAGRVVANLGQEVDGSSSFSFWLYDDTLARAFGEVMGYTGAGYNSGTLAQKIAIGKYHTGTYSTSKYQCRVVYGTTTGWFDMDVTRSAGWHQFTVTRQADGTTYDFYVDGQLGKHITGVAAATWDSVDLGFGTTSSANGNAWFDGAMVTSVPEPSSLALSILGGLGLAIGAISRRKA